MSSKTEGKKAGNNSRSDPHPNRLPKSQILKRQKDFEELFTTGSRIRGTIGQLIVKPWHTKQVAFVAGRNVGNAVTRNRLRRRLREFYRTHKDDVPDNLAVVFQVFPTERIPTYQEIEAEFSDLCKEL